MKREAIYFKEDKGSLWGIVVGGKGRKEGINEIILSFQTFFLKKIKRNGFQSQLDAILLEKPMPL